MYYEIELDEDKYFFNVDKLFYVKFRKSTYRDEYSLIIGYDDDYEIFDSKDSNKLYYYYCKIKELLSNRISE